MAKQYVVKSKTPCPHCNGNGWILPNPEEPSQVWSLCSPCNGTGFLEEEVNLAMALIEILSKEAIGE